MKALALDARVILMDEPTGWLAASEVAQASRDHPRAQGARRRHRLYQPRARRNLRGLRHGDDHARRQGRSPKARSPTSTGRGWSISWSARSWRAKSAEAARQQRRPRGTGEVRLSAAAGQARRLRDISFDLYAGEIFCITGLIGSKRTELVRRCSAPTVSTAARSRSTASRSASQPPRRPSRAASASCRRTGIAKA